MRKLEALVYLDEPLLEQVDKFAQEMGISRSQLIELALEDFIKRSENKAILEEINTAYRDAPDAKELAILEGMKRKQRKLLEGEW
jgi:predicted transcriptional regulator